MRNIFFLGIALTVAFVASSMAGFATGFPITGSITVPVVAPAGDFGVGWVISGSDVTGANVTPSATTSGEGKVCVQVKNDALSILAGGCSNLSVLTAETPVNVPFTFGSASAEDITGVDVTVVGGIPVVVAGPGEAFVTDWFVDLGTDITRVTSVELAFGEALAPDVEICVEAASDAAPLANGCVTISSVVNSGDKVTVAFGTGSNLTASTASAEEITFVTVAVNGALDADWVELKDTLGHIGQGGSLATATTSDGEFIYALRGHHHKEFWKFEADKGVDGDWIELAKTSGDVKEGGALAYTVVPEGTPVAPDGGDFIFAFRGGGEKDFWVYNVAKDKWNDPKDPKDAPGNVKWGGSLTWDGGNFIYAFRGDDKNDFWRYSISADQWTSVEKAPNKVKEGGALVFFDQGGDAYVYAMPGKKTKNFWRYDIDADSWDTSRANTPAAVGQGGALATDGVAIYALRGDQKRDFWRFQPDVGSSGTWDFGSMVPKNIKEGGALAYFEPNLFAMRGDRKKDFWSLEVGSHSFTP